MMKRFILLWLLLPLFSVAQNRAFMLSSMSPKPYISPYYPPVSGDITFTDADFQYSIPGYSRTGFTARSTNGYVQFRTSETVFDVKVGGNWSTASSSYDEQSQIEVLVNGVYNQSVTLTADNTTQSVEITLAAGSKIVRLVNGYTANDMSGNVILPENGVYVQGVVTTGNIEIEIPVTPADKWLFVGNSITTGASGSIPAINGYVGLFRADGLNVEADSWGARRLLTYTPEFVAEMAGHISEEMDGTTSNTVVILLGTNNFTVAGGHSAATFTTWYGNFLDGLHSIRPDITIYCISPLNRTNYDTPNAAGSTLQDYADAMVTMVSARSGWGNIFYINGKPLVSLANTTDGLHPNTTGMAELFTNLKPLLGL